jgi:hypothetical protein
MPRNKGSESKSLNIEMTNRNSQADGGTVNGRPNTTAASGAYELAKADGGTVNGRPNTTAASDAYELANRGSKQAATDDIERLMNTPDPSLTYKKKGMEKPNMWQGLRGPSRKLPNKRAGGGGPGMMEVPDYVMGGQEVYDEQHSSYDRVATPLHPHEKVGNQLNEDPRFPKRTQQAPTRANKLNLDNYGGYGDVGPLASSTIENYFDPTGPSGHGSEETLEEKIQRYSR